MLPPRSPNSGSLPAPLAVSWVSISLALAPAARGADASIVLPRVVGDGWVIAGDPDPGKYTSPKQQPVDFAYDSPVPPLPRPAWLERAVVICMPYETPYEPDRKALKPWARRLRDSGLTIVAMYPDGLCRLHEAGPDERWPEECRAEVETCHRLGIKVLAGVYPFVGERGPRDILEKHPEYRLVSPDLRHPEPGAGCIVQEGFGRALIDRLVDRVRRFGIDGYQFDGWYQCSYCSCDGCRRLYRDQTGREVPPRKDPLDPAYRRYVLWRDGVLLVRLGELRAAVRAVDPDFALVNWNNNDASGSAPSWMPEALNAVADWTHKEFWDAFDVSSVWLEKRLRGSSGDERPPAIQPYMFMRWGKDIDSGVYHGSSAPLEEVLYRAHEILAMGAVPIVWSGARVGWKPADWERVVDDFRTFVPHVVGTRSLKHAVCVDSYSSLQCARQRAADLRLGLPDPRIADELAGFHRAGIARALLESHVPFDVIPEHVVTAEALAPYRVAILPNVFCLSDRLAAVLREYVQAGGGLVATHETSLCDAGGKPRGDFALADLFGAHMEETVATGPSRVSLGKDRHPVTDDPRLRDLMGDRATYWGKYVRVRTDPGAATPLSGLDVRGGKERSWTPLVLREKGKGRVAFFAGALDHAYHDAGYPYERMLLAGAVAWTARERPRVTVRAPLCVLAGFFTAGERTTIVHLLNDIWSAAGHGSKDDKEFASREEIVPIAGVRVTFAGPRPASVRLVSGEGDAALEPRETAEGWEVEVPRLDLHAVVVAE